MMRSISKEACDLSLSKSAVSQHSTAQVPFNARPIQSTRERGTSGRSLPFTLRVSFPSRYLESHAAFPMQSIEMHPISG